MKIIPIILLAFMAATPVTANHLDLSLPYCAPREVVISSLTSDEIGEVRQSIALDDKQQHFFEMYANLKTGKWALIVTDGNNVSCLISSGGDYFQDPPQPEKPKGPKL